MEEENFCGAGYARMIRASDLETDREAREKAAA